VARIVWRRLAPDALAAFRDYLNALPAAGRPRYGLLGIKVSWWSRLGGPARPFVVLVAGDRIALSKRSFRRRRGVTRRQYRWDELKSVAVRCGPLLESARLSFRDGYCLRVGGLPRHQARPLERYLHGEADALDPGNLTPEQLTNFCQAMAAVGLPVPGGSSHSPP
jgi:hypothetical protein